MNKTIFVTGATSGFGEAIARKFALAPVRLILTGRREGRLAQLKKDLEQSAHVQVKTLSFDIQDRDAVNRAVGELDEDWRKIDLLINNAGLALGAFPIDEGDPDDWDQMINTNIKGLLYITRALSPGMRARKSGHIINIGSTAAKMSYRNGNVYCATKRAVESLTESMRIDLLPFGVKVTAIHPGAAETEFSQVRFKGDQSRASSVYEGFQPLQAQDVADVVHYCASLPPHVCINDLVLTCTAQADALHFQKM